MCSRLALGLGTLAVCCGFALRADDKAELAKVPLPAGLVAPDARVANAAVISFLEGPAVDAENNVYFSDVMGTASETNPGSGLTITIPFLWPGLSGSQRVASGG